jgi:hypothetical protein
MAEPLSWLRWPDGAIDSVQQPLRTVGRRPATAAVGRDCGDSRALPYHW